MSVLYSNTSTCYKRPLNSGNIFVDLIMRNHIWNGAIKKPLKIKYTYAQQGNFAEYLTYKDSFFLEMGCTYSAPYYRLAQITDPILQKLSTVFGPQYPKMAQYQTNDDLNTDFLYYAEDGS